MGNSKKSSGVVIAALTGALIGSAVAILYAPRSGKETRTKIREDVESTSRKLNDAALDFKGTMVENLEKHGDGIRYLVGSVIGRTAITAKEIIRALEKELEDLKIK